MEIGWFLGGFFILVTILFIVLAAFFPEWVGITGNKARQTMREQKGNFDEPSEKSKPSGQA
jgi:uncharacterized membrane protein (DUF485 family)